MINQISTLMSQVDKLSKQLEEVRRQTSALQALRLEGRGRIVASGESLTINETADIKTITNRITTVEDDGKSLAKQLSEHSHNKYAEVVTPEQFGAVGDGVHDDTAAVESAKNQIATHGGRFSLSKVYRVNSIDLAGVECDFAEGSAFYVNTGETISNVCVSNNPAHQIFLSPGKVVLAYGQISNVQWFGADATGQKDSTNAFNAALVAFPTYVSGNDINRAHVRGRCVVPNGQYLFNSTIVIGEATRTVDGIELIGEGFPRILSAVSSEIIRVGIRGEYCTNVCISGFHLHSDTAMIGVRFGPGYVSNSIVEHCKFTTLGSRDRLVPTQAVCQMTTVNGSYDNKVEHCTFNNWAVNISLGFNWATLVQHQCTVNSNTNRVILNAHGYNSGDLVLFRAPYKLNGDEIPAPLYEYQWYEVVRYNNDEFSLLNYYEPNGKGAGSPVLFYTGGSGVYVSKVVCDEATAAITDDNNANQFSISHCMHEHFGMIGTYFHRVQCPRLFSVKYISAKGNIADCDEYYSCYSSGGYSIGYYESQATWRVIFEQGADRNRIKGARWNQTYTPDYPSVQDRNPIQQNEWDFEDQDGVGHETTQVRAAMIKSISQGAPIVVRPGSRVGKNVVADPTANCLVCKDHGVKVLDSFFFQSPYGTPPGGLINGRGYVATPIDLNRIKLSLTKQDAIDKVYVTITTKGAGVHGIVVTGNEAETARFGSDATRFKKPVIKEWIKIPARIYQTFTIDPTTNVITCADSGLSTGDAIMITSTSGYPAPLEENTMYWWYRLTKDTGYACFSEVNAKNGVAIDITTSGSGILHIEKVSIDVSGGEQFYANPDNASRMRIAQFQGGIDGQEIVIAGTHEQNVVDTVGTIIIPYSSYISLQTYGWKSVIGTYIKFIYRDGLWRKSGHEVIESEFFYPNVFNWQLEILRDVKLLSGKTVFNSEGVLIVSARTYTEMIQGISNLPDGGVLGIAGNIAIDNNYAFPAGVQLQIQKDGYFTIANGKMLSNVTIVNRPVHQIFKGYGSVRLAAGQEAVVDWFGCDNVNDDTAFNKAFNALPVLPSNSNPNVLQRITGIIRALPRTYRTSAEITLGHDTIHVQDVLLDLTGATIISSSTDKVIHLYGKQGVTVCQNVNVLAGRVYSNTAKTFIKLGPGDVNKCSIRDMHLETTTSRTVHNQGICQLTTTNGSYRNVFDNNRLIGFAYPMSIGYDWSGFTSTPCTVDPATSRLHSVAHGLNTNDLVIFRVPTKNTTGELPASNYFYEYQPYKAIKDDNDNFHLVTWAQGTLAVENPANGTAVEFFTAGNGLLWSKFCQPDGSPITDDNNGNLCCFTENSFEKIAAVALYLRNCQSPSLQSNWFFSSKDGTSDYDIYCGFGTHGLNGKSWHESEGSKVICSENGATPPNYSPDYYTTNYAPYDPPYEDRTGCPTGKILTNVNPGGKGLDIGELRPGRIMPPPRGGAISVYGGSAPSSDVHVDLSDNTVVWANHPLSTGDRLQWMSEADTPPSPLVHLSSYYAIKVSTHKFRLATTYQNAIDSVAITLTTVGVNKHAVQVQDKWTEELRFDTGRMVVSSPVSEVWKEIPAKVIRNFTVNVSTKVVTVDASWNLKTEDPVWIESSGTRPAPLAAGVTYFWSRLTATTGYLCTTEANARSAVSITYSDAGTGTHTVEYVGLDVSQGQLFYTNANTSASARQRIACIQHGYEGQTIQIRGTTLVADIATKGTMVVPYTLYVSLDGNSWQSFSQSLLILRKTEEGFWRECGRTENRYAYIEVDQANTKLAVKQDLEIATGKNLRLVNGYVRQTGIRGSIHLHDGSALQSISNGTTYTKLTCFTDNGLSANCTPDVANDRIRIDVTGVYSVMFVISATSTTPNLQWKCAAFYDDAELDRVHAQSKITVASDYVQLVGCDDILLEAGKYVDLRIRHSGGAAADFIVAYGTLKVNYVGE